MLVARLKKKNIWISSLVFKFLKSLLFLLSNCIDNCDGFLAAS